MKDGKIQRAVKVKKFGKVDKENKPVIKDKKSTLVLNNNPVTSRRDIIKTQTKNKSQMYNKCT